MRSARTITASFAAVALLASSTAAVASAPAPQAPAAQTQTPNAWMMLSVLSPTRAVALGGANAAAQPTDVPPPAPPPPPPPEAAGALAEGWAPVAVIGLWAILIVIALATSGESGAPNSPA